MRSIVFTSVLFSMLLSACGSSSSSTSYQDPHSRAHSSMHNELIQEEIEKELNKQVGAFVGVYEGIIPCADCSGISIQLELFNDLTYSSEVIYKGKNDTPEKLSGSFTIKLDGVVALDKNVGGITYLQKKDADLIILDQNAKYIVSSMNEAYILKPQVKKKVKTYESDHPQAGFLKSKWDKGVVFYAIGNEPSWSLDIHQADSLSFTGPNGQVSKFPFTKSLPSIDPKIVDYRSYTDDSEITIQMVEADCGDSMSENAFAYQVNIKIKTKGEKTFQSYSGCGNIVPNYHLNGKWKVLEINGDSIEGIEFMKDGPYAIIDLFHASIKGVDGCNGFQGSLQYKSDQLSFGPTAGTMMACPNMEFSNGFIGSFSDKTLSFILTDNLTFLNGKEKVLVLERVE